MKLLQNAFAPGLLLGLIAGSLRAQATPDVVVVVDTSTSIAEQGFDPERTSLLVTKLLADIVPGNLAVVRLLDLSKDSNWLPSKDTGKTSPCFENASQTCHHVEPTSDWDKDVRTNKYGAQIRPSRGDSGFKQQLDGHLAQVIHNSFFGLAFRAAQGVFDSHGASSAPRSVIWLSDGTSEDEARLETVVREFHGGGVAVEAIVFGKGTKALAARLGLNVEQVRSPAELMRVFAKAFRRLMEAPYELDSLVAANPSFEMKSKVDEAWVVVYGDDTLGDVIIESPGGPERADYAQDHHPGAGAYRVLYVQKPAAGRWTVRITGGGAGAAYAVVQRSALMPILLEPRTATAGLPVAVVAGLGAERGGQVLTPADFPETIEMDLTVGGKTYPLVDNGTSGDRAANDGRYTGMITFDAVGETVVALRARSARLINKTVEEKIQVTGAFHYRGGPLTFDLKTLMAGTESCSPEFTLNAEHQGAIPFELNLLHTLPSRHKLEVRAPKGTLWPGGSNAAISPGDALRVCLIVERSAAASAAEGEPWLELVMAVSGMPDARVPIQLRWQVQALSFWQLWGWLILSILFILGLLFLFLGYIMPKRFQRNLALVFVPERDEIEEQSPQPISQWKGVGIGWYRDARAYLHANFRVSSHAHGALSSLHAIRNGTHVRPTANGDLYRETSDGEWELVSQTGRRASGEVFRVGDNGPYFKVSVRRGE